MHSNRPQPATQRAWATVAGCTLALLPTLAWASGGGGTCNAHDGCFEFQVHGYYILNFLVFVGLVVWYGRKPIAAALDKRYRDVAKEIEAAQAAKAEAEAQLRDYQTKVTRLAEDNARLLAEVRAGTDIEVANILAEARTLVDRATADEKLRLEQESKRLRDQLVDETARIAVDLAEQLVRQRLDGAAQERLVQAALADLEALPSSPSVTAGAA
ncbi:MAG: hypothetical protein FJ100_12735 [Deltaproteobacteria bacterium]|nr:hypothetical protein [Deltaproteobacteria bacterium]